MLQFKQIKMVLLVLVTLVIVTVTSVFLYLKWIETYWERRGFFTYRQQKNNQENDVIATYRALKSRGLKYGGHVAQYKPSLFTRDLDVVKAVFIKDAEYFLSRGRFSNPKSDPLSLNLLTMKNNLWKKVRSAVAPLFSSGKMKAIFPIMTEHAKIMLDVLEKCAESNQPLEARELARKFGMDAMGSCIFGFEINTLSGENDEFRKLTKDVTKITWKTFVANMISGDVLRFFRVRLSDPKIEKSLKDLVNDTEEYREKNNVKRSDIFHFLQQMTDESIPSDEVIKNGKLCRQQMINQITTFFIAGFETSSTVAGFALLELALHQDLQEKLRRDIRDQLTAHDGFTYEALMSMDYLDCVINETLRMYPPAPKVGRQCSRSYKIPGTDIVIQPGEFVTAPIYGIHMDEAYYPEPEKFDPERFTPENKSKRHPMAFLPFGAGPRNCIGLRLGLIVSKMAVAAIISQYRISLNEKTKTPIKLAHSIVLAVEGGVWINFAKVNN